MLSNLCCSKCKNDFDETSIKIIEKYDNILICNLYCNKCNKDFGNIVLKLNYTAKEHDTMQIIEGPVPINTDEIIDIHNYLKKL